MSHVCGTYTFERISVTSLWHLYMFAIKTFKCHKSALLPWSHESHELHLHEDTERPWKDRIFQSFAGGGLWWIGKVAKGEKVSSLPALTTEPEPRDHEKTELFSLLQAVVDLWRVYVNNCKCHRSVTRKTSRIRFEHISVTDLWHLYVLAIKTYKCHKSVTLIRFCNQNV